MIYSTCSYWRLCCKKIIGTFCGLFMATFILIGQPILQKVEGTITDENRNPLIGASVLILDTNPIKGSVTNESGDFEILNVPHGIFQIEVSYVGFQKLIIDSVEVNGKKFTRLDIELQESVELEAIVVKPKAPTRKRANSLQVFTIEETVRYPATFFDPARLATMHAGVLSTNDQANNLIVRGNSPNGMKWFLEGAEIVNPNHLSNAGTETDRVSISGGGVNILSAQLMKKANFYTSAFPAAYGNASAGIMDVDVRKGKYDKHHQTFQIGLLGIDLSAEGPVAKDNDDAYLINYRYSTIGLLSNLGVDLGDEEINFQDLAFNLELPSRGKGTISLFGMGGISNNIFITQRDTSLWEEAKDRNDITFRNTMGAIGLDYNLNRTNGDQFKTTVVFSAVDANREETRLSDNLDPIFTNGDSILQKITSVHAYYKKQISPGMQFYFGTRYSSTQTEFKYNITPTSLNRGDYRQGIFQAYLNYNAKLINRIETTVGIHYLNYQLSKTNAVEPRVSVNYLINNRSNISLNFGLHSQQQQPQLFFTNENPLFTNATLEPTRARHVVLGYHYYLRDNSKFSVELYHQQLSDVPVNAVLENAFSALNLIEGNAIESLKNSGSGSNYGVELSLKRFLTNDFFYLLNTSLYESKYVGSDGVERDTRFNGNYIVNLTVGKEFIKLKTKGGKSKRRIIGLNIRGILAGGGGELPIDEVRSALADRTIFDDSVGYVIRQKDFFKIDFRVYRTIVKNNFRSTLALDLQNATNQQNTAYRYYDGLQGKVLQEYQLGLIPNLSYRIEL